MIPCFDWIRVTPPRPVLSEPLDAGSGRFVSLARYRCQTDPVKPCPTSTPHSASRVPRTTFPEVRDRRRYFRTPLAPLGTYADRVVAFGSPVRPRSQTLRLRADLSRTLLRFHGLGSGRPGGGAPRIPPSSLLLSSRPPPGPSSPRESVHRVSTRPPEREVPTDASGPARSRPAYSKSHYIRWSSVYWWSYCVYLGGWRQYRWCYRTYGRPSRHLRCVSRPSPQRPRRRRPGRASPSPTSVSAISCDSTCSPSSISAVLRGSSCASVPFAHIRGAVLVNSRFRACAARRRPRSAVTSSCDANASCDRASLAGRPRTSCVGPRTVAFGARPDAFVSAGGGRSPGSPSWNIPVVPRSPQPRVGPPQPRRRRVPPPRVRRSSSSSPPRA